MTKKIITKTFGERLAHLIEVNGKTNIDVAEIVSLSPATISRYCSGSMAAKIPTVQKIAEYFNVNDLWLMGYEISMERPVLVAPSNYSADRNKSDKLPDGATPVDASMFAKIPIVGSVRCGEPMFAESNIEGYEYTYIEVLKSGGEFFYLRAKGDSMINAGINEGDLLLIRKQSDVDSGDIAIVNINGDEETLKRVIKKENTVILQPENSAYETRIFIGKELSEIHIQGRLMNVLKKF